MAKHKCRNEFRGEGARGGSDVTITQSNKEGVALVDVGHSCVVTHAKYMPVTWLAEIITIAADHEGGVEGFLKAHGVMGDDDSHGSYALMCDPALPKGDLWTV